MPEKNGMAFRIQVTPSVTESSIGVRALTISQRQCLFPDELRLSVFKTYTQQNCLLECRLRNIASFCGCRPYVFSAFTADNVPECTLIQLWCLTQHNRKYAWSDLKQYNNYNSNPCIKT
ncbi:Sodium channel protein Nach [Zootermopsis nevadensis]|uniref:Sodium channel protein Nach n=1 Tax=Zootermopsis nevadensis TaxID=136037 RepID=A0A067QVC0_ZOONE|nr:Sodium channel protein Nach [Zootermopsis nevadensis]